MPSPRFVEGAACGGAGPSHNGPLGGDNTSGTPPRDAAKRIRTTIHRVSVGVLRIKLHLVGYFVWVLSKTVKGFHGKLCYVQAKFQAMAIRSTSLEHAPVRPPLGGGREPVLRLVKQCISQGKGVGRSFTAPVWCLVRSYGTSPRTLPDRWKTGSLSTAILHNNRCAQLALRVAKRLHKREIPWAS